eukprot:1918634-Rhodomonas_salina.2
MLRARTQVCAAFRTVLRSRSRVHSAVLRQESRVLPSAGPCARGRSVRFSLAFCGTESGECAVYEIFVRAAHLPSTHKKKEEDAGAGAGAGEEEEEWQEYALAVTAG